MNRELPPIDVRFPWREQVTPLATPGRARLWGERLWRLACAIWKWALGAFLTQTILGAVLVMGWILRFMQRSVYKSWWKHSPHHHSPMRFREWFQSRESLRAHSHWPNWSLHNEFPHSLRETAGSGAWPRMRTFLTGLWASLGQNLRLGLAAFFNVSVLTMPGCALMLFSWYDGWNNSFNKGYEQAPVGPVTGLAGMVLFIVAMLYVPMAQARQAATGQWKSFYEFPLVWQLSRRAWPGCLILAALYSIFSIPLSVAKTAPYYLSTNNDIIANFTDAEALHFLNRYYFWCGVGLFLAWVILRGFAARLYARTLLRGLQKGEISVALLAGSEREALCQLDLVQIHPPRSRHVLVHVAAKTGASLFATAGILLAGLVWFTFAAQIYISEFLNYHPVTAWLNQPLAQLPWFRYIPPQLQNPMPEFLLTILFLTLAFGSVWMIRKVRYWIPRPLRALPYP